MSTTKTITIQSEADLKQVLAKEHMKQITNFFNDESKALEFLSNVVASVQRVPKLLECDPVTLINSFMMMASLKLMPSGVSGEAFVLPYVTRGNTEAQFQIGYQGWVTLAYRAGVKSIVAEIVRQQDTFDYVNGEIHHRQDIFSADRGEAIGAYVIIELQTGGKISKAMSKAEILAIAEQFSKSYKSDFSPWKGNDPQLWMWKKTVLKQAMKLVPKNETIYKALAADNADSVLEDRRGQQSDMAQLAAPTAIDVTEHRNRLQACTTKEELERVWADIPGDAKKALKNEMEDVKAMIMSEETTIS